MSGALGGGGDGDGQGRTVQRDWCYRGKRMFDVVILLAATPMVVPLGLLCALATRLTSQGPVLFRQERIGRHGESFELLKFRSMVHDPHRRAGFPEADAITPVGRWLRRLSLDELPQLLNVARGDISVVGPRPTLRYQLERYSPQQRMRLDVLPGLTGWAQVHGRNHLSWDDRIELDLTCVRRQSARLDLQILLRTARAVVGSAGVGGHPTDDPIARPEAA